MTEDMQKQKKETRLTLEEFIEKNQIKSLMKERLLYAKSKWEFLRRNKEFQKEAEKIEKYMGKPGRSLDILGDMHDEFQRKWRITDPQLSPDKSFEELVRDPILFDSIKERYNATDDKAFLISCYFYSLDLKSPLTQMLASNCPILYFPYNYRLAHLQNKENCTDEELSQMMDDSFKETGVLKITVDLTFSKNKLMKHFEGMIDELKPRVKPASKDKDKIRKRHRFDLYPIYQRVYDLMENKGMSFIEIEYELLAEGKLKENTNKSERLNEVTVKQYYDEAKRIIDNVNNF